MTAQVNRTCRNRYKIQDTRHKIQDRSYKIQDIDTEIQDSSWKTFRFNYYYFFFLGAGQKPSTLADLSEPFAIGQSAIERYPKVIVINFGQKPLKLKWQQSGKRKNKKKTRGKKPANSIVGLIVLVFGFYYLLKANRISFSLLYSDSQVTYCGQKQINRAKWTAETENILSQSRLFAIYELFARIAWQVKWINI